MHLLLLHIWFSVNLGMGNMDKTPYHGKGVWILKCPSVSGGVFDALVGELRAESCQRVREGERWGMTGNKGPQ